MADPSNLRCPRNGKWMDHLIRFHPDHWTLEGVWEGDENCFTSPDTGQHGGGTPVPALRPSAVGEDGEGILSGMIFNHENRAIFCGLPAPYRPALLCLLKWGAS